MSRIFITGDTHGDIDWGKLNNRQFPVGKTLTRDDYVIVCGDWGGVWGDGTDRYVQKWWKDKPYTLLFVDGNHENFEKLNEFPTEIWNGGRIHRIAENIIHLMRGQVFEIDGIKFYVMGGAASIDKQWRIPYISWWPEEIPSMSEEAEGFRNLEKNGNSVDVILTHDGPASVVRMMMEEFGKEFCSDGLSRGFDNLAEAIKFKHWFFGHYHIDKTISKYTCCYKKVYELVNNEPVLVTTKTV